VDTSNATTTASVPWRWALEVLEFIGIFRSTMETSLFEKQALAPDAQVGDYDSFGRPIVGLEIPTDDANVAYRNQYRFWRLGKSKGCVTTSEGPSDGGGLIHAGLASPWLAGADAEPMSDAAWSFRHVSSYFVSITFLLGSMLFVVGCAFDIWADNLNVVQKRGTVDGPFFIGCVLFTMGAYAGLVMVINAGREDGIGSSVHSSYGTVPARDMEQVSPPNGYVTVPNASLLDVEFQAGSRPGLIWWRWLPDEDCPMESFWGFWTYMVGSFLFTVAMGADFARLPMWPHALLADIPETLGGVFFVVGAHLSLRHNSGRCDVAWHVAMQQVIGAYLFLLGAGSGLYRTLASGGENDLKSWEIETQLYGTTLPYLAGSVNFLISSTLELWLWKQEKFGLALARPLNHLSPIDDLSLAASAAPLERTESGHLDTKVPTIKQRKRVTLVDVFWIGVSAFGCCAATMDLSFVCLTADEYPRYVLDSVAVVALSAGVIVLGSVVHRVPPEQPYPVMLGVLRLVMLLFAVDKTWEMASWFLWAGGLSDSEDRREG
jgi:hypothetical protein